MEQAMTELGLTQEQTRIMFSYQYHLTTEDIRSESDIQKKKRKQKWLDVWKEYCEKFLQNQNIKGITSKAILLTDYASLTNEVQRISKDMKVRRTYPQLLCSA
jgi:hypothetical protein